MNKIKKSLILKLLIIYLAGMTLLMVVTLFVQSNVLTKNLLLFQQSKMEKLGNTIAAASSGPMSNFNFSILDEFALQISKDPDVTDVVFKDADGKRLNSNSQTENNKNSALAKVYTFPILSSGSKIGSVEIHTIDKTIEAFSSNLQFKISIVFIAGFIIFIFLTWFTSKKLITSPLYSLLSSMQLFKNGKEDVKVEIKSIDEIGKLSESFNDMTESMRQSMHEISLKTTDAEKAAEEAQKSKGYLDAEYKYLEKSTLTIIAAMERFSNGDLTVSIKAERNEGEIHKLFEEFNKTVQRIKTIITHVAEVVDATANASTQISSSAEEMAAGAQAQSSQTGEIATAMEEMSSTILETNQNTSVAAEAAKDSGTLAEEGGKAVTATIKGMEKIAEVVLGAADTVKVLGEQSEKIGEIIHVINDIADQTNLLALNAAIEAARAGEQGRGFAVVADEVRKLAERTTSATKEIAGMINQLQAGTTETVNSIEQGVEEVNNGKELAAKAGESINEIVNSSTKVMDVITQVATASEEQSSTAEEISKNIESINMVAQESAAGVEQIAKASEDLNKLTDNLQNLVQQFKIKNGNELLSA